MTDTPGTVAFHRPARRYAELPAGDPMVIASPPAVAGEPTGVFLQLLLPVAGSLGIVGFAFMYHNPTFLAVAVGISLLSVVTSAGMFLQQKRAAERRRRRAAERYRSYLDRTAVRLEGIARSQREALERLHPAPAALADVVAERSRLWERRPADADFATVRVGSGPVDFAVPVRLDLTGDPTVEHEPDLAEAARAVADAYGSLPDGPVAVALRDKAAVTVVGHPGAARDLVRAMVCQLAAFHAPDDLRLVAWSTPEDEEAWDWMKWLPHARDAGPQGARGALGGQVVGLTVDPDDLDVLLSQIAGPRLRHLDRTRGGVGGAPVAAQQVVAVLDGYDPEGPLGRLAVIDELLARGAEIGVTLLVVVHHAGQVPARTGARLEIGPTGRLSYSEGRPGGPSWAGVRADAVDVGTAEDLARSLAPLRLRSGRARVASVDSEGLLELLPGAASGEAGVAKLATPIGIAEDGTPLVLDLREAAEGGMGPHGLVVGATGSGKSELLRTLVTGLALSDAPEELAMVLVDFKGGATFAEVAALPHVAGMITNLERDLTLVDRMHEALLGELERRQRVLQEHRVDRVVDYQRRRAADPAAGLPPLPSLLVIVDEFGELLSARPDFLDLFVSIGRTGRSVGVHLLLATQRLDEGRIRGLEGHLRYRLCLRTFSPEESVAALGTPDAFELPPLPGLGFLSVDGSLRRFKAATVSRLHRSYRPVVAEPRVVRAFRAVGGDAPLAVVDGTASPEGMPDPPGPADGAGPARTELQVAVARIRAEVEQDRRVRQVWRPPLPAAVTLDGAASGRPTTGPGEPGWLEVPLGVLDLPREQEQRPFAARLSGASGHLAVVGAPRTGKSTLLQTLVAGLSVTHDPGDVNVYAVDLGGGGLHALAGLPHVGGVHGRGQPEEVRRLLRELLAVVDARADAFRRLRLENMVGFHRARRAGRADVDRYGEVILVIDNWAQFVQLLPDGEDQVAALLATGLHYGVHVVVTANRWADLRLSLRDNIGGRLELRLNDPLESEIDRHAARALPADTPGRGVTADRHQFQVALPRLDGVADAGALAVGTEALVQTVVGRWEGRPHAPVVPVLPAVVPAADLPAGRGGGVVLGLEEMQLGLWEAELFGPDPHFLVLGDGECGKTNLLRLWAGRLAATTGVRLAAVDYRRQLADAVPAGAWSAHATTPQAAAELASSLAAELAGRLDTLASATANGGPPDRVVVFVDDYDLVSGPMGSPLAPLIDALAYGRDIGFHVVVARRVSGMARSAFEAFLQRLRELGSPTLVMSGDAAEGPVAGDRKAVALPPGRGFVVSRRRTTLVQTAWAGGDGPPLDAAVDAAGEASGGR